MTVYDPDAPTACGWWHWQVVDIPADVTELPEGAGAPDGPGMPSAAVQMRNDYGDPGLGSRATAERRGSPLLSWCTRDTETLGLGPDTTNAVVGFHLTAHALARATVVCTYSH